MSRLQALTTLTTLALSVAPQLAFSQPGEPTPGEPTPGEPMAAEPVAAEPVAMMPESSVASPPERHGLMGGFGLFGGNISCDGTDCGGFRQAGGGGAQLGYMFGPRLGLLVDLWAMTSKKNNVSISFITSTLNLRYYLGRAFWIQGGLGNGHAQIRVFGLASRGDDVPVGELAAGFEVVRSRRWAIDLSFKVAQGSATEDNGDVATGRSTGVGAHFTYFATR